jgi:hypothetical protein
MHDKAVPDNRRRCFFMSGLPVTSSGIWQPFDSILESGRRRSLRLRFKHRNKTEAATKLIVNMPENSQD